jgi:hypothetical protein
MRMLQMLWYININFNLLRKIIMLDSKLLRTATEQVAQGLAKRGFAK